MTAVESKKTITAGRAFSAGMSVNASEREITAWLEANPTAKITYTIDSKKYTVAMPTSREEVSRLRHAMAMTTSAKTRIAIQNVLKAFEALAAWMNGLKLEAPVKVEAAVEETSTMVIEATYVVWAIGAKRDWLKYEGTDLGAAETAYNKAVKSGKWQGVYIEVNGATERMTPDTIRAAQQAPAAEPMVSVEPAVEEWGNEEEGYTPEVEGECNGCGEEECECGYCHTPGCFRELPCELPAEGVEVARPDGYAIVEASQANCLRDYAPGEQFWVYGSPMRPMSSGWARIADAVFVNATYRTDKVHTWIVTPSAISAETIANYELTDLLHGPITWQPENVPTQAQEELQHASQSDEPTPAQLEDIALEIDEKYHKGQATYHEMRTAWDRAAQADSKASHEQKKAEAQSDEHVDPMVQRWIAEDNIDREAEEEQQFIALGYMTHEQLPWNRSASVEVPEHAPYCTCPACSGDEPQEDATNHSGGVQEGLQRIAPRQCSVGDPDGCQLIATWAYDGYALCTDCMRAMANLNSDNREAFRPAIEQSLIDTAQAQGVTLYTIEETDKIRVRYLPASVVNPLWWQVDFTSRENAIELANDAFTLAAYVSPMSFVAAYESRIPALESK